jgi:two-component system, NtrC family, sensor kinase
MHSCGTSKFDIHHSSRLGGQNSKFKNFQTVTIKTKNLGNAPDSYRVEISISDNGPGIPDAIKDKIFQPFFTTKPTGQGTGLGLSLSYDIVKAHGGELEIETAMNKGTNFIIKLKT